MAIRLPTASLRLEPRRFRRGMWLLSGDGPAGSDPVLGMRELVAEANHGYAYRVQTITGSWPYDEAVQWSDSSTGARSAVGKIPIEWGLSVVTIRLVVRCRHGTIQLRVNDSVTTTTSAGTTQGAALGTVTETIALNSSTLGGVGYAEIIANPTIAQTMEIVGWVIQEIVLTSGQIP